MSSQPRFLIAKYAPDLLRMEPKNIGIILWASGSVLSRFLGQHAASRLRTPRFVQAEHRRAYKEWISYWQTVIVKGRIKTRQGGVVSRESPNFLDALKEKCKPQFLLTDAGSMMIPVTSEQAHELVDELFDVLVALIPPVAREHAKTLKKATNEALDLSGVSHRDDFRHGFPVQCRIGPVPKPLTFDYAISSNGHPTAVFQRVVVNHEPSVNSAAFMFERLKQSKSHHLKGVRRSALVYLGEPEVEDAPRPTPSGRNLAMLEYFADVVDVADTVAAAQRIRTLVTPFQIDADD